MCVCVCVCVCVCSRAEMTFTVNHQVNIFPCGLNSGGSLIAVCVCVCVCVYQERRTVVLKVTPCFY